MWPLCHNALRSRNKFDETCRGLEAVLRDEAGLGDWQRDCRWIDAAHFAMRQILTADMGGQLLRALRIGRRGRL
jgi:hypothetical protein